MIAVSACLMGIPCRHNGLSQYCQTLRKPLGHAAVYPFCPEVLGGLTVPRLPAEIMNGDGNDVLERQACVCDAHGNDVTVHFLKGAATAVRWLELHRVKVVVLKENSPSCGVYRIHDGRFSGQLRDGCGVTTALLQKHHFHIFTESMHEAIRFRVAEQEG